MKKESGKIQDIVKEIGMKRAEEEQNKILEKYNLEGLNKEQIQGISDLISEEKKIILNQHKQFIKEILEELDNMLKEQLLPMEWAKDICERKDEIIKQKAGEGLLK